MAGPFAGGAEKNGTRPCFKWKRDRQSQTPQTPETAQTGTDPPNKPYPEHNAAPKEQSRMLDSNGARHAPAEAPVKSSPAFASGEMVELMGLQDAPDLNGRVGIVRQFDPFTGRHTVELLEEDGSVRHVRVRQANMDLLCVDDFMPKAAKPEKTSQAPRAPRPQPAAGAVKETALALTNAVKECDLFQVQALLRDKADPNSQLAGVPLLETASKARTHSLDLVALLLGYDADPSTVLKRQQVTSEAPEVEYLCKIFRNKRVSSDEERASLSKLDPGALAQARRLLKLPGPFALGGIAPAACLEDRAAVCEELEAASSHRLFFHSADGLRPVLVMRPSAGQPSALVVLLHGLFQSARMLEKTVRHLSEKVPHILFVMPTAPTRDGWSVGPAWFDHTKSAKKAEALEECRQEVLGLLSSQGQQWGIAPERVVLAGFSMGGTLAAWTALQVPRSLAGLLLFGTEGLSFTGGWASPKTLEGPGSDWATGSDSLQVLQCHGREDSLCPIGSATTCADELRRLGCSVKALAFQGVGHALSADMIEEATLWLLQRLPASFGG
mmetsp:Transcript_9154/g.21383  ORF Transcript_9154/g.21383 Transcript_9154/m.21383 type:complete len:555 (-) Transcript_9154:9-1673(-)